MQIQVPLNKLKVDPANVRKTGKGPSPQFIASIREEGVLEALTVRKNGDGYLAIGGSRRIAALETLAREGAIPKDHPVPCEVRDADAKSARNISLALNYHREGMHPVDEFEAFAEMQRDGMSIEDIRKKYGLTKREADQVLALGNLAPVIREAWRNDDIDEDAAQAFTLEADQKRQAELYSKLRKGHGLNEWTVRRAIVGEDQHLPGMIQFVGLDAYKAAGGATATDLFAEGKEPSEQVADIKLLKKLYDDKLEKKIADLKAEGWKWVEYSRDLGYSAQHWEAKGKSAVKAEERGNYGVIVSIDYQGRVEFRYGVQKPAAKKAAEKKAASASGKPTEAALSSALCGRLSSQMTRATMTVLEANPQLALAAIAAAMTSYDGPLQITRRLGDLDDDNPDCDDDDFATQFAMFQKRPLADIVKSLAKLAAGSLLLGGHVQHQLPLADDRDEDRVLLEAMDAKKLNTALRDSFDAADYFAGVTAQVCKEAILLCDPKQPLTGKEKKSELAKLAADLVKKSNAGGKPGYLPPEMRTAHYDGPKPVKDKPVAKAKAAKKAAKKKAK